MDYKTSVILPPSPRRKIPSPIHFGNNNNFGNKDEESRYQYDLKPDMFDPFGSSPPQSFMLKLKERISAYSTVGTDLQIKDFMRNSA
jgi:hypothetical protein